MLLQRGAKRKFFIQPRNWGATFSYPSGQFHCSRIPPLKSQSQAMFVDLYLIAPSVIHNNWLKLLLLLIWWAVEPSHQPVSDRALSHRLSRDWREASILPRSLFKHLTRSVHRSANPWTVSFTDNAHFSACWTLNYRLWILSSNSIFLPTPQEFGWGRRIYEIIQFLSAGIWFIK